jgi:hypothetical protein
MPVYVDDCWVGLEEGGTKLEAESELTAIDVDASGTREAGGQR